MFFLQRFVNVHHMLRQSKNKHQWSLGPEDANLKPSGCAWPLLLKKVVYVSRCHLSVLHYHLLMDLFAMSRLLAVT
ncbi:hypothetical protein HanPSC8_Chr17g0792111 [Helianthus annuus]|nr:hypothetical protein HanPSC8_Chr17g0792111 [Helianthus annuus]